MRDIDIMLDLLEAEYNGMNKDVAEMVGLETAVNWQPDSEANSINLTVWHLARVADFCLSHRIEGQDPDQQRWFTDGLAEKTGYDPRGVGAGGMGILTGYTREDVAAIPPFDFSDTLGYFNGVYENLLDHLKALPDGGLDAPVPGEGEQKSVYFWCRVILIDATRHQGEIQAIKAMWERQNS